MRFTMDFLMDGYSDEHDVISFKGIDLGRKWNGWACPAFDKETADEITKVINETFDAIEYMEYHDSNDGGYYTVSEDGIEVERFNAMVIEGVVCYPIGAYSWVWEPYF